MKHLFTYGPVRADEVDQVTLQETEIGMMPEGWGVVRLGSEVDVKGGKRLPKGHDFSGVPTQFPYIRIVDFTNCSVKLNDLKYLTPEDREKICRYIITSKDVYISIAGTIGLVGTVPLELDGANLTENAARLIIRDRNRLDKNYLVNFLASEIGQREIRTRTTKTSQPKLALMRIKTIPIFLPPLPTQHQIAAILSAVDEKIEKEENTKNAIDSLFQSMLHELMTAKIRVHDLDITT
jgi:type I restriction enzyme S subunit